MVGGLSLTSCAAGAFSLLIAMAGEATGQRQGALLLLLNKCPAPCAWPRFIFCIITPVARQAWHRIVLEELRGDLPQDPLISSGFGSVPPHIIYTPLHAGC